MSLQDDYFDLSYSLKGWQKEAFQRIWDAFVDMESEHEKLLEIRGAVRKMVELTFPSEEKQKVLVDDSASTVDEMKRKIDLDEQKIADAISKLTMLRWENLRLHESWAIESEANGNNTSMLSFIKELHIFEKAYGVFLVDRTTLTHISPYVPRWQSKPPHLLLHRE